MTSEDAAHDKIGHTIRDMIARSKKAESNSSNNKSITTKRKQQQKSWFLNLYVINLILLLIMTPQLL